MDDLKSLLILGRQPTLGLAELESLYGSTAVVPVGDQVAALTVSASDVDFNRLGGSVKLCKVLTRLNTTHWGDIERYLVKNTPEHAALLPEGKIQIGISVYGFQESSQRIQATGLSLKKAIKKLGRSVRLTPNQEPALSSAQVQHNHLTGPTGWELVLVRDNDHTFLAQTTVVQDIASYTIRDRERPKRDSRVGMLPPKLAQIIINLATGNSEIAEQITILDPFCGTGVILQEAELMGLGAYGSDLEPRMIDYSAHNLAWLNRRNTPIAPAILEIGDATTHQWNFSELPVPNSELRIACETYLGKPFTSTPSSAILATTVTDCNLIIKKFLRNIHTQIKPGTRLCIAVPAWRIRNSQLTTHNSVVAANRANSEFRITNSEFKHLPLVDSLEEIGYNQVRFEHVEREQLLYYREDQFVARELLVLTRQ